MGIAQIKHPKTGKIMNYSEDSLVYKSYLRNRPEYIVNKPATTPAPSQGTAPKPQTPTTQPAPSQGVTPSPQPAQPAPSTGGSSFVGFNPDAMKSYLDSLIPQIQVPFLSGTPYQPPTPSMVKAIKPAAPKKKLDHIYSPGESAKVEGYTDNQVIDNSTLVRYLDSMLKGGF